MNTTAKFVISQLAAKAFKVTKVWVTTHQPVKTMVQPGIPGVARGQYTWSKEEAQYEIAEVIQLSDFEELQAWLSLRPEVKNLINDPKRRVISHGFIVATRTNDQDKKYEVRIPIVPGDYFCREVGRYIGNKAQPKPEAETKAKDQRPDFAKMNVPALKAWLRAAGYVGTMPRRRDEIEDLCADNS